LLTISEAKSAAGEREHMFNIVGKYLLRNKLLNKAIEEILMEDQPLQQLNKGSFDIGSEKNLAWREADIWYGWTFSDEIGRYFFDDIGNKSLMGLWETQWEWEDSKCQN
jgi:hypothetical protein